MEEKPKQPQVHYIESQPKVSHSQKKKFSYKGKKKFHNHSNSQNKTQNQYHKNKPSFKKGQKKREHCYVCGLTNHYARDCYHRKTEPVYSRNKRNEHPSSDPQVNMVTLGAGSSGTVNSVLFSPKVNTANFSYLLK